MALRYILFQVGLLAGLLQAGFGSPVAGANPVLHTVFGGYESSAAVSVRELDNGDLLLSGYAGADGRCNRTPWLARMARDGTLVYERTLPGFPGASAVSSVAAANGNDQAILLAWRAGCDSEGSRIELLLSDERGQSQERLFAGDGLRLASEDSRALTSLPDGGFAVLARNDSGGHVLRLQANGELLWDTAIPDRYVPAALAATAENGLFLAGSVSKRMGEADLMFARLKNDGSLAWTEHYGMSFHAEAGFNLAPAGPDSFLLLGGQRAEDNEWSAFLAHVDIDALPLQTRAVALGQVGTGLSSIAPAQGGGHTLAGQRAGQLFLLGVDESLQRRWSVRLQSAGKTSQARALITLSDGAFAAAGNTGPNLPLASDRSDAILVVAQPAAAQLQAWQRCLGDPERIAALQARIAQATGLVPERAVERKASAASRTRAGRATSVPPPECGAAAESRYEAFLESLLHAARQSDAANDHAGFRTTLLVGPFDDAATADTAAATPQVRERRHGSATIAPVLLAESKTGDAAAASVLAYYRQQVAPYFRPIANDRRRFHQQSGCVVYPDTNADSGAVLRTRQYADMLAQLRSVFDSLDAVQAAAMRSLSAEMELRDAPCTVLLSGDSAVLNVSGPALIVGASRVGEVAALISERLLYYRESAAMLADQLRRDTGLSVHRADGGLAQRPLHDFLREALRLAGELPRQEIAQLRAAPVEILADLGGDNQQQPQAWRLGYVRVTPAALPQLFPFLLARFDPSEAPGE